MAEMNGRSEDTWGLPVPNFVPGELAEIGKKRLAAMMEMQKAFLDTIESMNQAWFERAKTEADLASELVTKLSTAKSVPETASAYQECLGKRMDMLADDSRRLLSDSQRFVNLGARFLTNGAGGNAKT
jgi:thermostable 8-oxoguanine DNA glycosylase